MKVLKISRNLILVFSIMGICALNMVSFFDNGQNTDVNLNQLMIRNAKDPNIHYGYIKDYNTIVARVDIMMMNVKDHSVKF